MWSVDNDRTICYIIMRKIRMYVQIERNVSTINKHKELENEREGYEDENTLCWHDGV